MLSATMMAWAMGAWCLAGAEAEELKSELREGTWKKVPPKDFGNVSVELRVRLKRDAEKWTISYETTTHGHVMKNKELVEDVNVKREGPFPVAVEGDVLVVNREEGKPPERYTFLCNEQKLVLPALVRRNPGEWALAMPGYETYVIRCDEDPFQVPLGKVEARVMAVEGSGASAASAPEKASGAKEADAYGRRRGGRKPEFQGEVKDGYYALQSEERKEGRQVVLRLLERASATGPVREKVRVEFGPQEYPSVLLLDERVWPEGTLTTIPRAVWGRHMETLFSAERKAQ